MNNSMTFEEQTEQIVEALFTTLCLKKPREQVTDRCLQLQSGKKWHLQESELIRVSDQGSGPAVRFESYESTVDSASSFNPVDIAKILKDLGDQYNAEIESQVQAVIAEESRKKIKKFGEVAKSLSRNWTSQNPELGPEIAFLAVAVKLFVNFIKKTHGDRGQTNILTETINRNPEVKGYIERQGGWGNLGRDLNSP